MGKFSSLGIAVDDAARLYLTHPVTGQPLRGPDGDDAWIDLLSTDSAVARQHERQVNDRRLQSRGRVQTGEQLEAERIDLLVKLTKDWNLLCFDGSPLLNDGKPIEVTETTVRELYIEPVTSWITKQVAEFVGNIGNFAKASSKS